MKMLLAGGGTGGHLFPAISIAEHLLEQEPESEVMFVGTERGIESKVLPEMGLPLQTIDIGGLAGTGMTGKMKMLPKIWKSLRQSSRILDAFGPQVVVGVGGYASGPMLMAAHFKGYPILIHEQNAWPGWTNRLLARWADRICLSFNEADRAFHHGRTVLTGNPLRKGMEDCPSLPEGDPVLLVFGGSQGARAINETLVAALPKMEKLKGQLTIIHQTGETNLEKVQAGYRDAGWEDCEVVPFINDMAQAYARAHLVLCRAGATTISELTACGRPSVLIPFPYAAGDHQSVNANALAEKGAALMLSQEDLTSERLATLLSETLFERNLLLSMSGAAKSLGRPGAAEQILHQCREIARKG